MTKEESIQHLEAVRAELGRLAGAGRKAQVQTFAGWRDADEWTPYGIGKPNSPDNLTVQFRYDPARCALREEDHDSRIPHDSFFVFGVWPVQFIDAQPALE